MWQLLAAVGFSESVVTFSCVAKCCSEVNCRDSPDKLRSCGLEIAGASTVKKRFPGSLIFRYIWLKQIGQLLVILDL